MIAPRGTTLVFSGIVSKELSISPNFTLEFTSDQKRQNWDEKVEQHLLRLNTRMADLEKKLENLNQTSSSDKKSSIGQDDGADVKVSPSVSLKLSNKELTDSGQPWMKRSVDIAKCSCMSPTWQKRSEKYRRNSHYSTFPRICVGSSSCEGPLRSPVSDRGGFAGYNEHARYFCRAPNNYVNCQYSMLPERVSWPMYYQGRIKSSPWYTLSSCDENPWEVKTECTDRVKYSAKNKKDRTHENAPVLPGACTMMEDTPSNETKIPDKDLKFEETSAEEDLRNKIISKKARQFRL